ncbi:MAG: hypothetical protein BWZ10_02991 [candidate division BRC1 bacterium ADurb.BinA364]|nr:MAG: hypothetical protein BWZ10_02991 [candidate division BRC1 bacterium ADurb.BinA364]
MRQRIGKQIGDLPKNILQKLERLLAAGAIQVLLMPGIPLRRARAAQLGVAQHRRKRMPRDARFGHDANEAPGRVFDNVANLVLCIIALALLFAANKRADARQFRIALDLDAPALIVGQVPMQYIHFKIGHDVDPALEKGDRAKMAAAIDHQSAPGKARLVFDASAGKTVRRARGALAAQRQRRQLAHRLRAAKKAFAAPGPKRRSAWLDGKLIAFLAESPVFGSHFQFDGACSSFAQFQSQTCRFAQRIAQPFGDEERFRVRIARRGDARRMHKRENAFANFQTQRSWNQRGICIS